MNTLQNLTQTCANKLLQQNKTIATAESCTGGLACYSLSQIPGISAVLLGGFVVYSNQLKHDLLNVPTETLEQYGAVSEQTLMAMLRGCQQKTKADIILATTGIAGPTGGSDEKPVGTVWLGLQIGKTIFKECCQLSGDRISIQQQSVIKVFEKLRTKI